MNQAFKDQNTGTVYQPKTYTDTEIYWMRNLDLVPADNAFTLDKKPSRITLEPKTAVYTGRTR